MPVHNRNASDGLWKIGGRRQAVYGRAMVVSREVGAAGGHHANRKTLTRTDTTDTERGGCEVCGWLEQRPLSDPRVD